MYIDAYRIGFVSMQKKTKLIRKIIIGSILALALAPQEQQVAQEAMRSVFLLRLKCVNTGVGNWARQTQDVSVGKAVYTSRLYMGPGNRAAALTCQLQPNEGGVFFQNLQLDFGMRDNYQDSPGAEVNVYLDGVKSGSATVTPGQAASISLDVASAKNVTVETVCFNQSRYCDRVYFWNASGSYTLPSR